MEQRALLASALVLGCVTAAGAGGFIAMRQNGPAASTVSETSSDTGAVAAEGTVADIEAPTAPAEPSAVPVSPAAPAASTHADKVEVPAKAPATRPAPVAPVRSTPTRTSSATAASSTAPARPSASPSVARPTPPPPARPAVPAPSSQTASSAGPGSTDNWPSRDYGNGSGGARDSAGAPSRDAEAGPTSADSSSLPSRAPVNEPAPPPAPVRHYEAVTIPADAVIGVQLESSISTVKAKVEDPVRARVTRDVMAAGNVVVPSGSRLLGSVTLVEQGGRVKERARLGVRFHTLILADGTEVRLPTDTIYREGESPAGRSAAKIGGATIGGAILGAIVGGGKGAAIGAATGAGSGTGWAMAGDRQPAELRSGQSLTVRVSDSVSTQIER